MLALGLLRTGSILSSWLFSLGVLVRSLILHGCFDAMNIDELDGISIALSRGESTM